jgi:hypothetical protein
VANCLALLPLLPQYGSYGANGIAPIDLDACGGEWSLASPALHPVIHMHACILACFQATRQIWRGTIITPRA